MTDLLTFIEATKGTSLKIEVTSKDLLEFSDALVERAVQRQEQKSSGRAMSNTSPRRRQSIFWEYVMRPYGIGLVRAISSPSCSAGGCSTVVPTSSGS